MWFIIIEKKTKKLLHLHINVTISCHEFGLTFGQGWSFSSMPSVPGVKIGQQFLANSKQYYSPVYRNLLRATSVLYGKKVPEGKTLVVRLGYNVKSIITFEQTFSVPCALTERLGCFHCMKKALNHLLIILLSKFIFIEGNIFTSRY